ncbi:hypothetical protein [Ferruginibacter sp.]
MVDYFQSTQPTLAYIPLLASCTFFIIIIIFYFFERLKDNSGDIIFSTFPFWFAVALIANFSGNFLLFAYSETTPVKDANFKINYTIIYGTVTFIKNILLCIAVSIKDNNEYYAKVANDNSIIKTEIPINNNKNPINI